MRVVVWVAFILAVLGIVAYIWTRE